MSYLVFCILDFKSGSRDDYLYAYADLTKLGLKKVHTSDDGRRVSIPSTAVMGVFGGKSVDEVRTNVAAKVQEVLKARALHGEFFVVVSGDWACGGGTT